MRTNKIEEPYVCDPVKDMKPEDYVGKIHGSLKQITEALNEIKMVRIGSMSKLPITKKEIQDKVISTICDNLEQNLKDAEEQWNFVPY